MKFRLKLVMPSHSPPEMMWKKTLTVIFIINCFPLDNVHFWLMTCYNSSENPVFIVPWSLVGVEKYLFLKMDVHMQSISSGEGTDIVQCPKYGTVSHHTFYRYIYCSYICYLLKKLNYWIIQFAEEMHWKNEHDGYSAISRLSRCEAKFTPLILEMCWALHNSLLE